MEEELNCPKCGAAMLEREFERLSVNQCPDGHGIFLARADLADLIEAENNWHREGGSFQTAPLPKITPDMSAPPPATPRASAWIATLFG